MLQPHSKNSWSLLLLAWHYASHGRGGSTTESDVPYTLRC